MKRTNKKMKWDGIETYVQVGGPKSKDKTKKHLGRPHQAHTLRSKDPPYLLPLAIGSQIVKTSKKRQEQIK